MADFGIPYMGSKQSIAGEIIKIFPAADHFYDLFGGGFSISHAMILNRHNDFKRFHYNEIKYAVVDLVKRAIAGEFNYDRFKPPFIDRETFFAKKDSDAYIRCLWSFGNGQKTYLFHKDIEPYKRSMHNAVIFNEFDDLARNVFGSDKFIEGYSIHDRRLFLRNRIDFYRRNGIPEFLHPFLNEKQLSKLNNIDNLRRLERLQQLEQLERLERLQQLQQLERLQQLQQLQTYSASYDEIPIKDNSIIYCDPPYVGTADYGNSFDHNKFIEWAASNKHPVFISEYNIADKRFKLIKKIKKRSMLAANKDNVAIKDECIYANEPAYKLIMKQILEHK